MVVVVGRPQPGANYIAIVDEFYRRIELIEKNLPADIEVAHAFDASRHVRKSVSEVQQTIFIFSAAVQVHQDYIILRIFRFGHQEIDHDEKRNRRHHGNRHLDRHLPP